MTGEGAGYFWPIWPALGWGIGLLAHGLAKTSWPGDKPERGPGRDERPPER